MDSELLPFCIITNALWCGVEHTALRKFSSLANLHRLNGLEGVSKLYCNHVMGRDMLGAIATVIRDRINEEARKSPALGLMIDESTDVENQNLMILYLRLLRGRAFETVFWGIRDVTSAKGIGLAETVATHFRQQNVDIKKVSCMCTDGASAMTGEDGGCVKYVRDKANPCMLGTHCCAHRHALACKDALEGNLSAEWFDKCLHDIMGYHSRSAKRCEHLRQLQEDLKIDKLRLVKIGDTRWLSRGLAIERLMRIWPALVEEFKLDAEENDNAIAALLARFTASGKFVFFLLAFADIIGLCCKVSKQLQQANVAFTELCRLIRATKKLLKAGYTPGKFVGSRDWRELGVSDGKLRVTHMGREVDFAGFREWIPDVCSYQEGLTDALDNRFPDGQMDVIEALDRALDIDLLPDQAQLDASLDVLLPFYGDSPAGFKPVIDKVRLKEELPLLVEQLKELVAKSALVGEERRRDIYAEALANRRALPYAKHLLCIYLALCLSTVCCERGFSDLVRTKTEEQNRMSTVTIDDRMMISQHVSREKMFDKVFVGKLVEESLVVFKNKCKRCPGRSNANAGRKKKVASGRPLSDALEDEAQEREGLQEKIDSEDEEETKVDNESPEDEIKRLQAKYGEFKAPKGCKILDPPAADQATWAKLARTKKFWKGKELGHMWNCSGWDTATFDAPAGKEIGFTYAEDGRAVVYTHELPIALYGATRVWVVYARE